jgi:hypothetical protein
MRKIFTVLILVLYGIAGYGQEKTENFVFRNTLDDTAKVQLDYGLATSHYLGDQIARKMHLFQKTYTYVEKGTPMSPGDKVIVKKPYIYYAIRKLNKHYKKAVRKDRMEEEKARKELGEALDICFVIYGQNTEEFEEYLKKRRKPDEILAAFDKVTLQ